MKKGDFMKKLNATLCLLFILNYWSNSQAIFGIVNTVLETADRLSFGAVSVADDIVNSVLPFGYYQPVYYYPRP